MSDTWGKGAINNNIGWGQASATATNNWGKSQKDSSVSESWSGDTNISGFSGTAVSITYPNSAYCGDASDPTPTITNNVGVGTFSSTTGLVFVSTTTGEVDLSASTVGATYVITYTDTDSATATFNFTINSYDDASFSYSSSNYMQSFPDPTPTITGVTGGTFSGSAGLVINSTTGEIDLDASTIATHTITYDTALSGSSVCANTSTQTVNVLAALLQLDNAYSMSFDGVDDYVDTNGTVASNLDFSVSAWIKPTSHDTSILGTRGLASASTSNGFTMNINSSGNLFARIFTETSNDTQVATGSTISLNNWSHVVMTYDSSSKTLKTYLNASEVGSIVGTDSSVASTANLDIGRASTGTSPHVYFSDKIDEVSVFNVELTELEVQSIYYATETGKTADLNDLTTPPIAWYRM